MFKCFLSGFLGAFDFEPKDMAKEFDISGYFYQIENDINKSYQELKRNERD